MKRLTKEQAIVLTGYTDILCCKNFSDFHEDVERRIGYPVFTHMFANEEFANKIKALYKDDFMKLVYEKESNG